MDNYKLRTRSIRIELREETSRKLKIVVEIRLVGVIVNTRTYKESGRSTGKPPLISSYKINKESVKLKATV